MFNQKKKLILNENFAIQYVFLPCGVVEPKRHGSGSLQRPSLDAAF